MLQVIGRQKIDFFVLLQCFTIDRTIVKISIGSTFNFFRRFVLEEFVFDSDLVI